jgi:Zn-dependent protease with chaperone function
MVMIRPLLIFISVVAISLPTHPLDEPALLTHRMLAAGSYVLLIWLATGILRVRTIRRLSGTRSDFVRAWRELRLGKLILFWSSVVLYACLILIIDWPSVVRSRLVSANWPLIDEFLIWLPLMAALIGSTSILQLAEQAAEWKLHRLKFPLTDSLPWNPSTWTAVRSEHGPWVLITLALGVVQEMVGWLEPISESGAALAGLVIVGIFSMIGLPWILRFSLPLERFADGRLRQALDRWAKAQNVGLREIFIWNSSHDIANAAVTGAWSGSRYVLLTRSIVDNTSPAELLGIFGHEVGHAKHGHLSRLFRATVLIVIISWCAGAGFTPTVIQYLARLGIEIDADLEIQLLLSLLLSGPAILILLGWMSRLFELQADREGCRSASVGLDGLASDASSVPGETILTPSGIQIFGSGLERVAIYNGIDPDRWTWRGGRLRDRIRQLQSLELNPRQSALLDAKTLRQFRWLEISLFVGAIVAVAATGL